MLSEDFDLAIGDVHMGMPLSEVIDRLCSMCAELSDEEPEALERLDNVLYPLLIVERTMDVAVISTFKRLGAGSFATVFVSAARGGVVVKQVKDPADAKLLCKEHNDLEILIKACDAAGPSFFSLPRPYGFYNDCFTFAREAGIPCTMDLGLPPHALYVMQRIWPVPASLTERIRELFFPVAVKNQPFAPFLARLYLGRAHSRMSYRFFCPENFPLDAARIEELALPASQIAAGMGQMLATINFRAGRDARGIKFILCGDADNPLRKQPAYSCIGFNQMRAHNGDADVIVSAIAMNDFNYPRPSSPLWASFVNAYTAEASLVDSSSAMLAHQVLAALHKQWTSQQ